LWMGLKVPPKTPIFMATASFDIGSSIRPPNCQEKAHLEKRAVLFRPSALLVCKNA
jgi:hypothetical protein